MNTVLIQDSPKSSSTVVEATGIVRGRVTDAAGGQPVNSVQVAVLGTMIGILTGANGEYILPNVPAGPQTIVARRIGYAESRQQVTVTAGQTTTADFTMSITAATLSDVVVTGVAAPAERRALGNSVESIAG